MPTITIPASEVRQGDVISIGGDHDRRRRPAGRRRRSRRGIAESDGNPWPTPWAAGAEGYRDNARAALAAYREHTQA